MIRNEKMAEKMGWVGNYWGSLLERRTPDNDIVLAKILQQRMVDDGWSVEIWQHGDSPFPFKAKALSDNNVIRVYGKTEPAAIVELFCGVYAIPASE